MRFLELITEVAIGTLPTPQSYTVRDVVLLYSQGMSDVQMARRIFPNASQQEIARRTGTLSKHVIAIRHTIGAAVDENRLSDLAEKIGVTQDQLTTMIGPRPRPNLSAAARQIVNTNPSATWSQMEALLRQWAIENSKECHPHSVSKAIQIARKAAGLGERRAHKEPDRSPPYDPAAKWRD